MSLLLFLLKVGPPSIGRHELRLRLLEDVGRFAAAVPHTSRARGEGEIDGQDYNFVSRSQFEDYVSSRRFVEHGEFDRQLYGTTLDAIRTVINSGKVGFEKSANVPYLLFHVGSNRRWRRLIAGFNGRFSLPTPRRHNAGSINFFCE